jgi:hypothetical protein
MGASFQGLDKFKFDVGGSNIKSIQSIETTYYNQTSKTITISAVNPQNTIVYVSFGSSGGGQNASDVINVELTNSTTVTLTSTIAGTNTDYLLITVVEYNNVKSKQTGSVASLSSSTTNITISPVNINKCILAFSFSSNNTASWGFIPYMVLTASTNLKIYLNYLGSLPSNIKWQILEFN